MLNSTNVECLVHCCKNVPGYPGLEKFIRNKFAELEIDEMSYSQWESVDRRTLWINTADMDNFIELLVYSVDNLTRTPSSQRAKLSISNRGKKK